MTRPPGLASVFIAVLAVATAVAVTMVTMLTWFVTDQGTLDAWRSLIAALAAAGVALGVVAMMHIILVAIRQEFTRRGRSALERWTRAWSDVAVGGPVESVHHSQLTAASEAAAAILQHLTGDGAQRLRAALKETGVLTADLELAGRGLENSGRQAAAAVERLAWIADAAALDLFRRAAGSQDRRASRAAVFGAVRILARERDPEPVGQQVVEIIEDHVVYDPVPKGTRSFLSAAMVEASEHLGWLCAQLLARREHEAVHVAALDAIGASRRPEALDLAVEALINAVEDETEAAALRTIAKIGQVPDRAVASVVEAAGEANEGIRVQAAHALTWVPATVALPSLWTMLGDLSWEVRRAAALALVGCGSPGERTLKRAASSHPDRFARDIAAAIGGFAATVTPAEPRADRPPAPAPEWSLLPGPAR